MLSKFKKQTSNDTARKEKIQTQYTLLYNKAIMMKQGDNRKYNGW